MNETIEARKRFIINVLYFALAAALLYAGVKYALGWILPFIIGLLVALLLKPVMKLLARWLKIPQKVSAIVLVLLFYAVVGFLIFLIGAKIVLMIQDLFNSLPNMYTQYLAPQIASLIDKFKALTERLDPSIAQMLQNTASSFTNSTGSLVSGLSTKVLGYLSSTVISLPGVILFIVFSIVSSVFFALDYKRITTYVSGVLPEKMLARMHTLKAMASDLSGKYVRSYAILISVTFAELSVGLLITGVKNAIALAAIIAFIDLLPVLGTGAVLIPWALVELILGNYGMTVGLAIIYVVIIVVRNILEPRIVGKQIGVHPLAMLISMYVGLKIFGFIGIFVLPICLLVFKGFYEKKRDNPAARIRSRPTARRRSRPERTSPSRDRNETKNPRIGDPRVFLMPERRNRFSRSMRAAVPGCGPFSSVL